MHQGQPCIDPSSAHELITEVCDRKVTLRLTVGLLQFKEGDRVYGLADTFTFLKKEGALLLTSTPVHIQHLAYNLLPADCTELYNKNALPTSGEPVIKLVFSNNQSAGFCVHQRSVLGASPLNVALTSVSCTLEV